MNPRVKLLMEVKIKIRAIFGRNRGGGHVICEYLEIYDDECGDNNYAFYCMCVDAIADPNECISCPYLLDKDKYYEHQLKIMNEEKNNCDYYDY